MLRFLLLIIVGLGLGLLYALGEALRRRVVRTVQAIRLALAGALAIGGVAAAASGLANGALWVTIAGAVLLLVAFRIAWPLVKRRSRPSGDFEHVPLTGPAPDPRWSRFESGLDWGSRQQARRSRTAIEGFVAERESPSLTHEHRSLLLSFDKRVPELIDACLERCRNADRSEQRRYMAETLERLVQIGNEAERARLEIREADDQRLKVLHRYFDGLARDSDERPRAD
jgi:hypothetical protein